MLPPPDAGLHRLTYLSSALAEMSQGQLDAILEVARANNPRHDVTGLLLYHDMQFFQALEGPRPQVEQVFARIKGDRRHSGCMVLESRAVTERFFAGWSMAYKGIAGIDTSRKQNFLDLTRVRSRYAAGEPNADISTRILLDSFLSSFRDLDLP
jgi:hypothetical protein